MYLLQNDALKLPSWLMVYSLKKNDEKTLALKVLTIDMSSPIEEWTPINLLVSIEDKEEFMAVNNLGNCCLVNLEFVPPSQK